MYICSFSAIYTPTTKRQNEVGKLYVHFPAEIKCTCSAVVGVLAEAVGKC